MQNARTRSDRRSATENSNITLPRREDSKMRMNVARTAEHVGCGHPDKFCDQLPDAVLDQSLERCGRDQQKRSHVRVPLERLANDHLVTGSGETRSPLRVQSSMMCGQSHI